MESVVLVIHLILALAIIGLVLLQRSEGGGLGIGGGGGGGGGLGNFASARGTANMLTKLTALCALGFFITSLTLGVLAGTHSRETAGILEDVDANEIQAPISGDEGNEDNGGIEFIPPADMPATEDGAGQAEMPQESSEGEEANDETPQSTETQPEPLAPAQ